MVSIRTDGVRLTDPHPGRACCADRRVKPVVARRCLLDLDGPLRSSAIDCKPVGGSGRTRVRRGCQVLEDMPSCQGGPCCFHAISRANWAPSRGNALTYSSDENRQPALEASLVSRGRSSSLARTPSDSALNSLKQVFTYCWVLPSAPSAGLRSNIGLRASCARGIKLR